MTRLQLTLVACLGCLGGCASIPASTPPHPARQDVTELVFPYKWIGLIDKGRLDEPSGIVYHPTRRTLFAVGDEGDIIEMATDGTAVNQGVLRKGADLEAITCDPSTGLLYVAIEGEERLLEVDPQTFGVLREFAVGRTFNGQIRLRGGGEGLEGLCFVPDSDHPEGGVFYITNQAFSLKDPEDTSALCRVEAPLRTAKAGSTDLRARIVQYTAMPVIDMSDLHYDVATGHLFVACDADNVLMEVTLGGVILRIWALPGNDQEGIAVDDEGNFYVAQDSGGIIKLKWKR